MSNVPTTDPFEPFAVRSAVARGEITPEQVSRRTTVAEIDAIQRKLLADRLANAILRMGDRIERAGYECGLALARGGDWKKHLRASNRRLRALARLVECLTAEVTR